MTDKRPNGTFLGGFYWAQPYGLADYEEEWGRKWLDGFDYEFAVSHPFYDKTGRTRPFGDKVELDARRLRAAARDADETWGLVGYKIERMIFDVALSSLEDVSVSIKELGKTLRDCEEWL